MFFWTCVKRLVALCLNAEGVSEKQLRRLRWREEKIKERERCHLLS